MAIADEVALYNLALNAIGARSNVTATDEASREAEVCGLWYTPVRDQVLAAAAWPETTKIEYLGLVDERDFDQAWVDTNARPGYTYAYEVPDDFLHPQYLADFAPFIVTTYPVDVRVIDTNTQDAILVYTALIENVAVWGPSLQMAIVYALASHICMPLTGKPQRAKMVAERANDLIWAARERAANTSNEQFEFLPEWLAGRGYAGGMQSPRFMYPFGDLFQVA